MLFTEPIFLFGFLPATVLLVRALWSFGASTAGFAVLTVASFIFYGSANPSYVVLLASSIVTNYLLVAHFVSRDWQSKFARQVWLTAAVGFNLGMLGYFKYRDFFLENLAAAGGPAFNLEALVLPVGISFYVFEQLALVVDVYRGYRPQHSLLKYGLWVAFFPHLVAGPIMRHQELVPQFSSDLEAARWRQDIAIGITFFTIGLFKKAVLADTMAGIADDGFLAASGGAISGAYAWLSAAAYALQIYFDFSGYSDMAIGLALMFGILLPLNFDSPYKSTSIIEFWRRWHMTLSRFLRDYLYIPLGGGRHGPVRRWFNVFVTMLLGGLWHGASWNFVLWGGLHGVLLAANHAYRQLRGTGSTTASGRWVGWLLTMLAVVVAWVPFRSETLSSTLTMWGAMTLYGSSGANMVSAEGLLSVAAVFAVAIFLPNSQQIMGLQTFSQHQETTIGVNWPEALTFRLVWSPGLAWSAVVAVLIVTSILSLNDGQSPFIYFRF